MLIFIKGNDFSAKSKVTLIFPVRLKGKLKTISDHRMPTDWQFTSTITITITYERQGVRCAVCGVNTFIVNFTVYCLFDRCCCCRC